MELQDKIKKKKKRKVALIAVIIVIAAAVVAGTTIEYADYHKKLDERITAGQTLLTDMKANMGNGSDQYSAYVIAEFEDQLKRSKLISGDKELTYEEAKSEYLLLSSSLEAAEKDKNQNTVSAAEMKKIKSSGSDYKAEVNSRDGEKISVTIDAGSIESPQDVNLDAGRKGPYYSQVQQYFEDLKTKGEVIAFYNNNGFGSSVTFDMPVRSGLSQKAWVYRFSEKNKGLTYIGKAKVKGSRQKAVARVTVTDGGTYLLFPEKITAAEKKKIKKTRKKLNKKEENLLAKNKKKKTEKSTETAGGNDSVKSDGQKTETVGGAEDKDSEDGKSGGNRNSGDKKDKKKDDNSDGTEGDTSDNGNAQEDSKINVKLSIRCDTLADDMSKLENEAIRDYIPSSGVILSTTSYKAEKGDSVYDVLYKVCRNKNIHMNSEYTPSFGTYYVTSIGHISEFDAGDDSGWMFSVNGRFPNYGSSEVKVSEGDSIRWEYTCRRTGGDL